jgi:hypothetical protein
VTSACGIQVDQAVHLPRKRNKDYKEIFEFAPKLNVLKDSLREVSVAVVVSKDVVLYAANLLVSS